jgi:hypothetical protein
MNISRIAVVTLALAAAAIFGAYLMLTRELGYEDLRGDAAYALQLPGSEELSHGGGDTNHLLGRNDFAFAVRTFGADVSTSDVFAYYDRELSRLGWRQYPSRVSSSTHLEDRWYCRSGAVIDLATIDQSRTSYPKRSTIFQVALLASTNGAPCPPPVP